MDAAVLGGREVKIQAVIFDLDDTLVATAPLWKRAETTLLSAIGKSWEPGLAMTHRGMNALDVATVIHAHHQPPTMSLEEAKRVMRGALISEFETNKPIAMPGAVECIKRAAKNHRIAVASGSPPEAIQIALRGLGVLDLFEKVISSESVTRGKPWPDVYLKATKELRLEASQCIAVEDTLIGAKSARAAGMDVYVVPSNPEARGADWAIGMVGSLEELF
jgi:HAD superfamily hydrolase (TIGR01509 family)